MQTAYKKPLNYKQPSSQVQDKLNLSASEVGGMALRDIKCPHCGFLITRVYADIKGHYFARCRKCKSEQPLNLAYFRRQKGIWRLNLKYYGKDYFEKLNN